MRALFLTLLLGWQLWTAGSILGVTQEPTKSLTKAATLNESVVSVESVLGSCTGFIGKPGYVVTAAHCLSGDIPYLLTFHDGTTMVGFVAYVDTDDDWAVLRTFTGAYPPAKLSKTPLDLGDKSYHIRFNAREGKLQWRANGIYAGYYCAVPLLADDGCHHWIALAGVPGDSGGPVFIGKAK